MKELGISVYPFHSKMDENKKYIDLASKYGFTRCFMCLLSVEGHSKDDIVKEFSEIINYASKRGIKTTLDIAPNIFSSLEISYSDLSFFKKLGAWAIRLDVGFGGSEESMMTFNEQDLKIELNMSNDVDYLDSIIKYCPNKDNLIGCHNFYPHGYTGLNRQFFNKCTDRFKKYSITTSAFVNAKEATFGPWPVDNGLCTLEEHRNMPIDIQAMDLFNLGIDCVFISNCYASEESLKALSNLDRRLVTFKAHLVSGISEVEKNIVLKELHFNRGDISEYVLRSTQPRVKYKGHNFKVFNTPDIIKRGDIVIESSEYGHYAGEMQIALKDMKNSGKSNVVGNIDLNYTFLLDTIKPWQKFRIKE